jgi:hypothetical protein
MYSLTWFEIPLKDLLVHLSEALKRGRGDRPPDNKLRNGELIFSPQKTTLKGGRVYYLHSD